MPETIQPARRATGMARTRGIDALLAETRLLIEPTQRAVLDSLPDAVRKCAGFHMGWWEIDEPQNPGHPVDRRGKAVRPAMTIACARAAGGLAQAAIPAAVAVELMHDFSLLHDDIMDGDLTRRHRPTAWAAFGVPMALLTGDTLLVHAFDLVHDGPSGAVLRAAALELCAGQSADLTFESRMAVGLPDCLRMAEQKTAALFAAACRLGALSATDDLQVADFCSQFGRHLGIAFQLVDDILGIWGCEASTGKPVYSDLRSRKKSLPVVAAMSSGTAPGNELTAVLSGSHALGVDELAHAADLINRAGGRAWAEAEAARHRNLALDALAAARPEASAAGDLRALAELMTTRVS